MNSSLLRCCSHFRRSILVSNNVFRRDISSRTMSSTVKSEKDLEAEAEKPISYLNSNAANWKAANSRKGTEDEMPWYQPLVICGSVTVFLLYFCVLREENDLDLELGKSLYDRVPDLEIVHLLQAREYNLENGKDVTEIEDRLRVVYPKSVQKK